MKTYYVLEHKETGVLMPNFPGRAGGTYVDPFTDTKNPPRLFMTEKAAATALTWWARGFVRTVRQPYEDDPFGSADLVIDKQEPVPGRNVDDWRVVPIKLEYCDYIQISRIAIAS